MANQLPKAYWESLGENGAFLSPILASQAQQLQLQNQEPQNHFINVINLFKYLMKMTAQ